MEEIQKNFDEAFSGLIKKENLTEKKECELNHDFKNVVKKNRADYRCPICNKNVVVFLILALQSGIDLTE